MRTGPLCLILLTLVTCPQAFAGDTSDVFTVVARPFQHQTRLFAEVTSQHIYGVTPSVEGRLSDLSVKPGEHVQKGQLIARLTGSGVDERIQAARQAITQDQADVSSARTLLDMTRQKKRQTLATRQDVLQAQLAVTRAEAKLAVAKSQQAGLADAIELVAPTNGKVMALMSANGDYVKAGQPILRILPDGELWLSAQSYGRDATQLYAGLRGQFFPDGGSPAIPVVITTSLPDTDSPGTWNLYLTPTEPSPHWFAGEAGKLVIQGPVDSLPAVPHAALIMDQGKWWIMRKDGKKIVPVPVVPAATRNGWTWLKGGLSTGQQVMVKGAYQAFHRNFAHQYANPD